ncbi:hypothetical protein Asi03nite_16580 [Actinoplanes siamensis]|uniref:Uncharacterized protein n=1 Tax=Actinoplanes siamensis TaxID=1223317 RepID=A0A919TJ16_9ACTN|nr:hypothetical protein Asi03nite_16580 [Actinoplanes siamensis]
MVKLRYSDISIGIAVIAANPSNQGVRKTYPARPSSRCRVGRPRRWWAAGPDRGRGSGGRVLTATLLTG